MKKFVLLALLAVAAVSLFAAAPTTMTADGAMVEGVVAPASTYNGHSDSLIAPDSLWVLKGFTPEPGYEYILTRNTNTSGGDTVDAQVLIDAYYNSTLLARVPVDSFTAGAGEKILLPLGQTVFGTKYDLIIKTYAGTGGWNKYNGLAVLKRRLVGFNKNIIF
jgi:hypothetical protein